MINPCGHYCDENCPFFISKCAGCHEIAGQVFWAKYYQKDTCPIYACASQKGYAHCGLCPDIPCKIWHEVRDPDLKDDALFHKDIAKRIQNLRDIM